MQEAIGNGRYTALAKALAEVNALTSVLGEALRLGQPDAQIVTQCYNGIQKAGIYPECSSLELVLYAAPSPPNVTSTTVT
jgi:hypothetical protein